MATIQTLQNMEAQIDISVKRLFTIRFRLGMFDPAEMVPFSKIDTTVLENPKHQAHATVKNALKPR